MRFRRALTAFTFLAFTLSGMSCPSVAADPGPGASDDEVYRWIADAVAAWIDPVVNEDPGHPGAASREQLDLAECLKGIAAALEAEAAAASPIADTSGAWPSEQDLMISTRPARRTMLASASALFVQERDHASIIGEQSMRLVRAQRASLALVSGLQEALGYAVRYEKYNSPPFPPVPDGEEIPQFPTWLAPHWLRAVAAWESLVTDTVKYDCRLARSRSSDEVLDRLRVLRAEIGPRGPTPAKPGTSDWWLYLQELEAYFADTATFIGSTSRIQEFVSYGGRVGQATVLHGNAVRGALVMRVRRSLERARLLAKALDAEHIFLADEAGTLAVEEAGHASAGLALETQRQGVIALEQAATLAKTELDGVLLAVDKLRALTSDYEAAESAARQDVAQREAALANFRYSCTHGHASADSCPDATQVTSYYRAVQQLDATLGVARKALLVRSKDLRDHRAAVARQQSLALDRRGRWLEARSRHLDAAMKYASDLAEFRYEGARLAERRQRNTLESKVNQAERTVISDFLAGRWAPAPA